MVSTGGNLIQNRSKRTSLGIIYTEKETMGEGVTICERRNFVKMPARPQHFKVYCDKINGDKTTRISKTMNKGRLNTWNFAEVWWKGNEEEMIDHYQQISPNKIRRPP